jgi:predicted dehydrogenase
VTAPEQTEDTVRWAILGTARIAGTRFLPGLHAAGGGTAYVVAGRDGIRARGWAVEQNVQSAVEGYTAALVDPLVRAVYVPLPNALHADWTISALQAGKAVLCEKPLCVSADETARVLDAARDTGQLLWEAFVFPFHPQTALIRRLIDSGVVGALREIEAAHSFPLSDPANVRWDAELGGGALFDVGCYPVRLARLLFGAEPVDGAASSTLAPTGVDAETEGWLDFGEGRRLRFRCGFRAAESSTRVVGEAGELRISGPYHPTAADTVEVWRGEELVERHETEEISTFAPALRHINDAVAGRVEPQHLAVDDALGQAMALDRLRTSAGLPQLRTP